MKIGKSVYLLIMCFNLFYGYSKSKYISDSLSHLAYSKTNHDTALMIFKRAQKFLKNDEQKGIFYFYKYFYFLKNNYIDSSEKIQDLTLDYLSSSKQFEKFEWIFSTTYWVYVGDSHYDKAMQLTQKVEKITRESNDSINHIYVLNKWSNLYHDLENFKAGIDISNRAINESKKLKNNILLSSSYIVMAMNYDDWGKYDSAIFFYYKILKLKIDSGYDYSQVYNNLGNTYLKKNQLDSAFKYVNLAYNLDKNKNKPYELATCINNLGHLYLLKKDFKKAKFYLDTAYYYSKLSDNHEKLRDVNYTLYLYYKEMGDFEKSILHLEDYHNFKDSILDVKRLNIISNLESKTKEANYQNELLKLENAKAIRNYWIILFISLLFIALLILRQVYLKRQKIAREAELNLQKERLRISRDLHDNIGAELTYISSYIDKQVNKVNDVTSKAELEKISDSSRYAMSQMRETIWAIQNKKIDTEELKDKLYRIIEKYTKIKDIESEVYHFGENYILNPSLIISVIRITQEAVNNSVKYSGCKKIILFINSFNNNLKLEFNDNGSGFDINNIKKGNGMINMKERVEELGGTFKLESKLNEGTKVSINLPL